MSRTNRLIAVPPLSAKAVSAATSGKVFISRATCLRYASFTAIDRLRNSDVEGRVQLAASHEHSFSAPEVDILPVQLLQPGVRVPLGEPQEQALHFYVTAGDKQRLKSPRAEIAEPLHQNVRLMKGLTLRNLVEQFKNRSLRRRHGQWPFPLTPRLPYVAASQKIAAGVALALLPARTPCFDFEELFRVVKDERVI